MAEPVRDKQSVTPEGEPILKVPAGVKFHDVHTHVDERGEVCEVFDTRWKEVAEPALFAYSFTIRPGVIKGWAVHRHTEDRYFLLFGEMEVVLYDDRPDSPTRGLVSKIILSAYRRRLMNIPPGVWHADRNIGNEDVIAVNFKTVPYDHANPDKFRLPVNNDKIPYKFDNPRGW